VGPGPEGQLGPRDQRQALRQGQGEINWGCSSHLLANPAEVVSNIEKVPRYPDVWLTLRTTVGSARYVRVEGGRLYADQNNPSANAVSCDYEDFKAALLAAANSNQEEGKGMT
jgi:hypothetical protein